MFKLDRLQFLLPNESIVPDCDFIESTYISHIITDITRLKSDEDKIIIYQGSIGENRDFTNLVEILHELPYKTYLLIVFKDHEMVDKYKSIHKDTCVHHIKVSAHLTTTKLAEIGIICYHPA